MISSATKSEGRVATTTSTSSSRLFPPLFSLSFTEQKRRNGRHRRRPRCGACRVPTGKCDAEKGIEKKENSTSFSLTQSPQPRLTKKNKKTKKHQGNQKVSQRMMRARVAFQGLTVATMLASSMFVLKEKTAAAAEGAPAKK